MKVAIDLAKHAIQLQGMWNRMHVSPVHFPVLDTAAKRLYANKPRFLAMTELTHVPWDVIAVIKLRESGDDPNFEKYLGNGQSLKMRTTIVPKGRGPFVTWEQGAYDALVNCEPYASKWKDWTIGGTLCLLEQYNGLGYAERGVPSPYLWSYSDQYVKGKYNADEQYDPFLVDPQYGCAPLLSRLFLLDRTISDGPVSPNAKPQAPQAQPVSWLHRIFG